MTLIFITGNPTSMVDNFTNMALLVGFYSNLSVLIGFFSILSVHNVPAPTTRDAKVYILDGKIIREIIESVGICIQYSSFHISSRLTWSLSYLVLYKYAPKQYIRQLLQLFYLPSWAQFGKPEPTHWFQFWVGKGKITITKKREKNSWFSGSILKLCFSRFFLWEHTKALHDLFIAWRENDYIVLQAWALNWRACY